MEGDFCLTLVILYSLCSQMCYWVYLLFLKRFGLCSCSCGQVALVFVLRTPPHAGVFLYVMVGFSKLPFRTFQKYSHYRDGGGV